MDARLVMFRDDGERRNFPLLPGATTIGRKNDCDIRIPLSDVSRRHSELRVDGEAVYLKDLGSANGTFLNNRRLRDAEQIGPGDQVMVGPVVFTLQVDGEPGDEKIIEVRSRAHVSQAGHKGAVRVGTSKHVYMSDEEIDPIAALEALAASADQTAISPEEDEIT